VDLITDTKKTSLEEIGICSPILKTALDSIVNIIREDLYESFKKKEIPTLAMIKNLIWFKLMRRMAEALI
jgi:hypothetical protein